MRNQKRTGQRPLWIFLLLLVVLFYGIGRLNLGTSGTEPYTLTYSELLAWVESDLYHDHPSLTARTSGTTRQTIERVLIVDQTLYGCVENSTIPSLNFDEKHCDFIVLLPSQERFLSDVKAIYASVLGSSVSPTEYTFACTIQPVKESVSFWSYAPLIGMVLLLLMMWLLLSRAQGGGAKMQNFGRSRARLNNPERNHVRFDGVAGAYEEKQELMEIVDFLKNPKKYMDLGARIPKGVLLVGPPGTGKTLLAKAVAGEAGVPFFTISGSDFVEMYVGVGASRVRDLFEQAKEHAPAIVFIDEIDAVGRQRGTGLGGSHDEREQTLNQLLVEMDGFTHNEGVVVMAATNRSDILDPALLRPGRFDRQITVNYPDSKGREEILTIYAKGKPLDDDVDLHVLASRTTYFTGADLENVMNEGALLAARENLTKIPMRLLEEAITRVGLGPEKKSRIVTEAEKKYVAYHEAGHAIVAHYLPVFDHVHEVSIISRGQAGGYTMFLPEERQYRSSTWMRANIAVTLGGQCAERIIFHDVTTGPSSDIKHATQIARSMVTEYGMSDELGPIFLGGEREVFLGKNFSQTASGFSDEVNTAIDREIRRLLEEGASRAMDILRAHLDQLEGIVALLLEREKVTGEEFAAFMNGQPLPAPAAPSGQAVPVDDSTPQ